MSVRYLERDLVIPDGSDTSASDKISSSLVVGIRVPTGFLGTSLTPEFSSDDVTWDPVYDDDGNAVAVVVAAAPSFIYLLPQNYAGFDFIRWVSDAAETGGPLTLKMILRAE